MRIRNILHKGLRRLIELDDRSGVPPQLAGKLRNMVTFLQAMQHEDEVKAIPLWNAHLLTGNLRGTWSLSVTRNWRLTFRIDGAALEIIDLDFQDYH